MYTLIVLLPLIGFLVAGLFGRAIGDRASEVVTTSLLGLAAVLSWVVLFTVGYGDGGGSYRVMDWIVSGDLDVAWSLRIDALTAVMLVVVNTVSFLVHVYSIGYMHHDGSRSRFFAYLSLFTFAMLTLVTADNLVQMFFGWEGVGLASYLLIGFWHHKASANAAAMKAFIVNRVGDFGFALGIFGCFIYFGSVQFDVIFAGVEALEEVRPGFPWFGGSIDALTVICLLLFLGAMGKSAQVPLHTWLPDAMEGPTPVSALIHAATMVTAGVFMVARMSPLFEAAPAAMTVVLDHRRPHRHLRRDDRAGPERYQARHRLLDLQPTRLHVRRARRRGLVGGDLPPLHPRLLQGAAVPRRRLGDPCRVQRAGHAPHGWLAESTSRAPTG